VFIIPSFQKISRGFSAKKVFSPAFNFECNFTLGHPCPAARDAIASFGKRYNIPGFHPHLLRHTSATLSLTNGGDAKNVADRLGHADAATLLRNYAHANDESIRLVGQAARDALRQKKDTKAKSAGA
jgi:integrase